MMLLWEPKLNHTTCASSESLSLTSPWVLGPVFTDCPHRAGNHSSCRAPGLDLTDLPRFWVLTQAGMKIRATGCGTYPPQSLSEVTRWHSPEGRALAPVGRALAKEGWKMWNDRNILLSFSIRKSWGRVFWTGIVHHLRSVSVSVSLTLAALGLYERPAPGSVFQRTQVKSVGKNK